MPSNPGPPISFKVAFEGQAPDKEVQVFAYAFDRQGKLLASAPVKEGKANLKLSKEHAARARLLFGPPAKEEEAPSVESLRRLSAFEAVWRFDSGKPVQIIDSIPEASWKLWLRCKCRVRGRVVRPVEVAGASQDLPVCHVRVHIREVDRWPCIIAKLPDRAVFRLRDELMEALDRPIPLPSPVPDPPSFQFDPGVIDPSPENLARMLQPEESSIIAKLDERAFNPQPEPPAPLRAAPLVSISEISRLDLATRFINPQPEPPLARLEAPVRASLTSGSLPILRQALSDHFDLIRPYLCRWLWFTGWLTSDELVVVETDSQGRFDTTISYPCFGDHPDLYFWVEACIGGSWQGVYRPSMLCHTYWNYACGSEVTIRVTDPRVPVCQEPPDLAGLQVAVMSIGNNVSISEIQGSGAGEGLVTGGAPFGGILEPHVWFGSSSLIAAGITHYRWSYRRKTDASGSPVTDSWHHLARPVVRHYGMIEQTPPDFPLSFPSYALGPDPVFSGKDLFQIQPAAVPVTPPAGSIITGWSPIDARQDSASAFFATHQLSGGNAAEAAGKYELKLEIFDSTGNRVNLSSAGILLKEADQNAPFGDGTVSTIPAKNEHLLKDGADTVGFRITLRVDNNPCAASIDTISGPSLTVNSNCGFVLYPAGAPAATIRFTARHPHDFAWFSFQIHRGPSILVPEASAGGDLSTNPNNGFFRNASGTYVKSIPVHTLLTSNKPPASPDCVQAALAETLYLWARATDGWNRLHYLDARGTPKAFALAPKP